MNSAASSPSKKPLAPLVAALAIEAVSIDSASVSYTHLTLPTILLV